ncbi:MAG TPA: ABC transporter permease [Thermomicrobiaceae bacterium]|nr:ABC transporter permease [Thermomicrobiaceae bacterium]
MAEAGREAAAQAAQRPLLSNHLTVAERVAARSYLQQSWLRFKRNRLAIAAGVLVVIIFCFGFGAPLISKYVTHVGYADQTLLDRFKHPGQAGYLLGTDNLGRDVLTRLAYGTRVSTMVALLAVVSALTIGGTLGSLAGYYGRWVDSVIMRFVDIMLSIPALFLLIFIGALFTISSTTLALVIAAVSWMGLSRLIRGEIMSLKRRDYVEAARVVGASDTRIIARHIVPNVLPIVIVWATLAVPVFIIVEASLSFLGLGVQPPVPSLGNMLNGAIAFMDQSWTLIFIPGFMIYVMVLAINLFGNGLRDALDPRLGEHQ